MSLRIETLTIDAHDPGALAQFWADVLAGECTEDDPGEFVVAPADGAAGPQLLFLSVPDDKVVKNRLHLDLRPDDQAAEVARLEGLGARRVSVGQDDDVSWRVLADPEGNEFCVLRTLV